MFEWHDDRDGEGRSMASPPGKKDACLFVLIVGGGLLTGAAWGLLEGLRWLV